MEPAYSQPIASMRVVNVLGLELEPAIDGALAPISFLLSLSSIYDFDEVYLLISHRCQTNLAASTSASSIDWFPLLWPASPISGGVGNPIYVWSFQ
jgi:hypothetical protein